jgi:serine/threonine-protein kinase
MGRERFETIDRLYHAALSLEPHRRAGFLRQACGADDELRQEIESLLELEEQAKSFIDRPAIELVAAQLGRDLTASGFPVRRLMRPLRPAEVVADRFEIVAVIGSGGMGDVYEAKDRHLGQHVALKTIRPELAGDERMVARFKQEILLAKRVTHQNVCRIYDVGFHFGQRLQDGSEQRESGPLMFLTMELLRGESLADRLEKGRLNTAEALPIVEQIAAGLQAAHEVGVVHRDFKSANVMLVTGVSGRTRAVITDFGLARNLYRSEDPTATMSLTQPGEVAGTPDYMAPEQVLGTDVTFAADIYALGVVIYEMVTGNRPFNANTPVAAASKRLHEPPTRPSRYVPDLDRTWEAVILRCLEREPPDRFGSATSVYRALAHLEAVPRIRRSRMKRRAVVLAAVGAAVSVPGSVALWRFFHQDAVVSLAVMPFSNGDSSLDHISEGMTEDLINAFGQRQLLRVISRASVYGFQRSSLSPQELGRRLNVQHLLTGRVQRTGELLSVTVELTSAEDGVHLWGQQYQRRISELVAVEEDISRGVVESLQLQFSPEEQKSFSTRRAVSPEVIELYWRARFFWNKRTQEGFQKAIEYFNAAIEKDPKFALAYTGLADSYAMRSGVVHPKEVFPKAKAAALKALELDESLAEAHASLAFTYLYFDWNWLQTEKEYRRAIQLNPNYPSAHSWYAMYLVVMKQFDRALAEMRRALELDPPSLAINTGVGRVHLYARNYDEAAAQYTSTLEMDPNFPQALFDMGTARAAQRRYEEALGFLERAIKSGGQDAGVMAEIAYVSRRTGRDDRAEKIVQSLNELSKQRYVSPYYLAVAHLGADDGRALDLLERAYEDRSWPLIYLDVDARFDRLRSHPRHKSLLQKLGFVSA